MKKHYPANKRKIKNVAIKYIALVLFVNPGFPMCVHAQNIFTVAGDSMYGFNGDGGAAIKAELNQPAGVTIDGAGNIYIADQANNRVRKVYTSGIITTIAGNGVAGYTGDGGIATGAELNQPAGVAVDGVGNIYISDSYNNRIRKVSASGIITTFAGGGTGGLGDVGPATLAVINNPNGVAIDGSGNLYIADQGNNRIRKVNMSGIITTIAGNGISGYTGDGGAATTTALFSPTGVAVDGAGNIYIADEGNMRIRKVNTSGIITTFAGSGPGNGTPGYTGDGGLAIAAELNSPAGVAVDGAGNIYIADAGNIVVRKVNLSGIITTVAGNNTTGFSGDGGAAVGAQLDFPAGVALDAGGNLYIADFYNSRIRKVSGFTGIDEFSNSNKIIVYPVPSAGLITACLNGNGYTGLKIFDLLGREVYSQSLNRGQRDLNLQIDISNIPNGVYIMLVVSDNGTATKRMEVQK
jgi:sugar lactone lactonase YvrE